MLSDSNYKYISALLVRHKKVIKLKYLEVCSVPHLKGLTIKDLLEFVKTQIEIDMYIPDYEYDKTPNRSWIWNVINSLWRDKFSKFIDDKISERVKHTINMKSLNIRLFLNSSIYSSRQSIYLLIMDSLTFYSKLQENASGRKWRKTMQNNFGTP